MMSVMKLTNMSIAQIWNQERNWTIRSYQLFEVNCHTQLSQLDLTSHLLALPCHK